MAYRQFYQRIGFVLLGGSGATWTVSRFSGATE
jgi:hypothetical protein